MSTFRVRINLASATESFEALRERDHDDLALAAAMTLWYAETVTPVDWNIRQLRLRPEPAPVAAPPPDYREIRFFPGTGKWRPMPRPGGQLLYGCPDFHKPAEAAWFTRRTHELLAGEPPDDEIVLDDAAKERVEGLVTELLRQRKLLP